MCSFFIGYLYRFQNMHTQCKLILYQHLMKNHYFAISPHFLLHFKMNYMTWKNEGFPININVKLIVIYMLYMFIKLFILCST